MRFLRFMTMAALVMGSHFTQAQTRFGLEYDSELQYDLKSSVNHVNLLRLETEVPLGHVVTLEATSITIAKTSRERLVDDLQTFSNIEEENLPFSFARLSLMFALSGDHTLHAGIRNMNEDYFTSPVTALFTNSSCGIFPTISCNYPIANYPLSSLGVHYAYDSGYWQAEASIYNGKGYNRTFGRNHVFRFNPKADGIFVLGQGSYDRNGSGYYLGGCLHTSPYSEDVSVSKNSPSGALWCYAEQYITEGLSLILDYSHAYGCDPYCKEFFGLGGRYKYDKVELGLFTDYARFVDNHEWATELTCRIDVNKHISIQPALHLIAQKDLKATPFLFRLSVLL